jgi:hypothetical protein
MTPCQLQFYPIVILPYSFIFVNDELGLLIYVVPIMTRLLDIDIGVMYAFMEELTNWFTTNHFMDVMGICYSKY